MNTKKIGYTYNPTTNTLTMTAAFSKKAGMLNTPEYRIVKQLRADNPNLVVEKRTSNAKHHSNGIKYAEMEAYIGKCRNSKQYLSLLATVKELSKGQPNPYRYVREWFEKNFTNYAEPVFDAEGFIKDGAALDAVLQRKILALPFPTTTLEIPA